MATASVCGLRGIGRLSGRYGDRRSRGLNLGLLIHMMAGGQQGARIRIPAVPATAHWRDTLAQVDADRTGSNAIAVAHPLGRRRR